MYWPFSRKIYMHNSFLNPCCENNPSREETSTSIPVSEDICNGFAYYYILFNGRREVYTIFLYVIIAFASSNL